MRWSSISLEQNTGVSGDYFPVEQAMDWLGDEGVVLDNLPHSPLQMMLILLGRERGGTVFLPLG